MRKAVFAIAVLSVVPAWSQAAVLSQTKQSAGTTSASTRQRSSIVSGRSAPT